MASLKDSDLFLMQRDDDVLSFNGMDFKDIVVEAGQGGLDNLGGVIDTLDEKVGKLDERVVENENTIDVLSEAVNTLLKTSTKARLNSYDKPADEAIADGQFYMTDAAAGDVQLFSEAEYLYISATTSNWSDPAIAVETIFGWGDLRLKGKTADGNDDVNEIGDYIQVFNAESSGYGLFSLIEREVIGSDGVDGYKFKVEYVKGDGGQVTSFIPATAAESRVFVIGFQTKVGLDIDQADERYLVKQDGGVVIGDTEFMNELKVGSEKVTSTHTENAYLEADPVFTVRCKNTDDNLLYRRFQVRSNGEVIVSSEFKPCDDNHVASVKYVKGKYLSEDGSNSTISANGIYLRLDGTVPMKNTIRFDNGDNDGNIIKMGPIRNGTAKINPAQNNFNITISYDKSFTIGLMDYNTFTWLKGKATASDTHHTFCVNNYKNSSNERYLATLGSVNKALEDYPLPEKATRELFGLVKLSDNINNNSSTDSTNKAASEKAVHDVNVKIYRGMPVAIESATAKAQAAGGFRYSNGNLYYRVN